LKIELFPRGDKKSGKRYTIGQTVNGQQRKRDAAAQNGSKGRTSHPLNFIDGCVHFMLEICSLLAPALLKWKSKSFKERKLGDGWLKTDVGDESCWHV